MKAQECDARKVESFIKSWVHNFLKYKTQLL